MLNTGRRSLSNLEREELGQMKHLIISIFTGVALASAARTQRRQADNNTSTTTVHRGFGGKSQVQVAPVGARQVTKTSAIRTQGSVSTAPMRTHTYRSTSQFNGNATVRSGTTVNTRLRERHANTTVRSDTTANARVRDRNVRFSDQARVRSNVTVNRDRSFRNRTFSGNTTTNVGVNRNRNVTVTNNWRGSRFSGQQYAAFRNYHRQWHDRGWWSSHYNRIIFVGGGWYFWDGGYWYPAWGYDRYPYYPTDGPIYGYRHLNPGHIVVDEQTQMHPDG